MATLTFRVCFYKQRTFLTIKKSWPVSRVLSWTAIHLGCKSPCSSSNLPRNRAGRT